MEGFQTKKLHFQWNCYLWIKTYPSNWLQSPYIWKALKVYYSTLAIALASLGIWIISDVFIGDEFWAICLVEIKTTTMSRREIRYPYPVSIIGILIFQWQKNPSLPQTRYNLDYTSYLSYFYLRILIDSLIFHFNKPAGFASMLICFDSFEWCLSWVMTHDSSHRYPGQTRVIDIQASIKLTLDCGVFQNENLVQFWRLILSSISE